MELVTVRPEGLYCPQGDFYIDPWRPVERAVLTHAHGDHARPGSAKYLAAAPGAAVLRKRLDAASVDVFDYAVPIDINGVRVSLHPAGHVLGSAQVRIEYRGEVWVVSGDYKLEADATCMPFEPVRCHTFITESTFGLPIYRWVPQRQLFDDINAWWKANAQEGRASVLFGYAFGKAQRLLAGVDAGIGPLVCHGAVETVNEAYRSAHVKLPATVRVGEIPASEYKCALVIAPPSAQSTPWLRRFSGYSDGFASGWMQLRRAAQTRRRPRFRPFGSCRLARPAAGGFCDRSGARHRHAWLQQRARKMVAATRPASLYVRYGIRRRGSRHAGRSAK